MDEESGSRTRKIELARREISFNSSSFLSLFSGLYDLMMMLGKESNVYVHETRNLVHEENSNDEKKDDCHCW